MTAKRGTDAPPVPREIPVYPNSPRASGSASRGGEEGGAIVAVPNQEGAGGPAANQKEPGTETSVNGRVTLPCSRPRDGKLRAAGRDKRIRASWVFWEAGF